MAFNLYDVLTNWENIGFFHVALPFLLIFTLIFAVLQKTKILGTNSKNFNAIVGLIIAALAVRNQDMVMVIQRFLPNVSIFVVVGLMFLLLIGIFAGKEFEGFSGGWLLTAAIVSFVFVAIALTSDSLFVAPFWLQSILFYQDVYSLAMLGAIALVLWLILREPGRTPKPWKDIMQGLGFGK